MVRIHDLGEKSVRRTLFDIPLGQWRNLARGIGYMAYAAASLAASRKSGLTNGSATGKRTSGNGPVERAVSDAMNLGYAIGTVWQSIRDFGGIQFLKKNKPSKWIDRTEDVVDAMVDAGENLAQFLDDVKGSLAGRKSVARRPMLWIGLGVATAALSGGVYEAYRIYQSRQPVASKVSNRLRSWIGISAVAITATAGGVAAYWI